jgi:Spy/CpxP family protein refolding chaperone
MKKFKTAGIIALSLAILAAGTALAGRFGKDGHDFGMKGFMGFGIIKELDLSETQKTDAANILMKYRDEATTAADTFAAAREKLADAILIAEFNEGSVRLAVRELAVAGEELAVLGAKAVSELKPILTPAQLELLKQKQAEMKAKMKDHTASRRSKIDNWLKTHISK